jgi:hypothetical protein
MAKAVAKKKKKKKKKSNEVASPMMDKAWEADCDLDTLIRAEEIKANSRKMTAVKKAKTRRVSALKNV